MINNGLLTNLSILLALDELRILNQLDFATISDLFNLIGDNNLSKWKNIINTEYVWRQIMNTQIMHDWINKT
jgi:hypothetical protein